LLKFIYTLRLWLQSNKNKTKLSTFVTIQCVYFIAAIGAEAVDGMSRRRM